MQVQIALIRAQQGGTGIPDPDNYRGRICRENPCVAKRTMNQGYHLSISFTAKIK